MKNNPDLLQVSEVVNVDADLTVDESKINSNDVNMEISEKEEQNTVEYQETLRIDVKNIDKSKNKIWRPIYEVIDAPFFKKWKCFHKIV